MTKPLAQAKRQKVLIVVLVVIFIIIAFIWYMNFQKPPAADEEYIPPEGVSVPMPIEERLKEIKLDVSTLDNSLFKSLRSHGLLPVTAGETGRENPLEPY